MTANGEATRQSELQGEPGFALSPWYSSIWKRTFDVVAAVSLLILLCVPMMLIALAVKLTSPGPVFFRQRRPGRGGREFIIFKFRSMIDNRRREGRVVTRAADPRVTRFGGFMRKWKLDELPQLFNVLRAEMSFVGPRPLPTRLWQHPSVQEWAVRVLSVRPGITSQATVNFRNEEELLAHLSFEDVEEVYRRSIMPLKMAMELEYLCNASFTSDMRIIFKTVLRVFHRHQPVNDLRISECLPVDRANSVKVEPQPSTPKKEYVPGVDG